MPKVEINAPSPDFVLNDHKGGQLRLSDLRGKKVLLVFNRTFT